MQLLLIVALLFALAVAVFAVQNAEAIIVNLFGFEMETSLVLVVLAAAAAGAVIAGIIGAVGQFRASLRLRQLQGKLQKSAREVEKLTAELERLTAGQESALPGGERFPGEDANTP